MVNEYQSRVDRWCEMMLLEAHVPTTTCCELWIVTLAPGVREPGDCCYDNNSHSWVWRLLLWQHTVAAEFTVRIEIANYIQEYSIRSQNYSEYCCIYLYRNYLRGALNSFISAQTLVSYQNTNNKLAWWLFLGIYRIHVPFQCVATIWGQNLSFQGIFSQVHRHLGTATYSCTHTIQ